MSNIKVTLFGKFSIDHGEKRTYIRARKVQELLIYLLVFRNHPKPRESLSEALWGDEPAPVSRRNLRQTLWHLQAAIRKFTSSSGLKLLIEDGWIHIRLPADFWLDTAEFEQVFQRVNQKQARELGREDVSAMQYAVDLYRGDLLEGWYQDWCIFERERFQIMNLTLLDKLVQYCEIHGNYEAGLAYGWRILKQDHAYERAHRQLMRLYALSGDRTQALYQYQRCVNALQVELGVEPSARTRQLYEQIQSDTFVSAPFVGEVVPSPVPANDPTIEAVLDRLQQFSLTLKRMDTQVQQDIAALETMLADKTNRSSKENRKLAG
jgi:DNA-binding SARP family transcriptional activator